MKKSLRSERNKRVAILSILGFVLVGLTGYYMYQAYTGELGSSAAMCRKDNYTCNCSNGTKKEISYSFCDSRYGKYTTCKTTEQRRTEYEDAMKKADSKINAYQSANKKLVATFKKMAGSDGVVSNKECLKFKYCKSTVVSNTEPVSRESIKDKSYAEYVDLVSIYNNSKSKFDEESNKTNNSQKQTCVNDIKLYEAQKETYIQRQCGIQCTKKTPNPTTEKRAGWFDFLRR